MLWARCFNYRTDRNCPNTLAAKAFSVLSKAVPSQSKFGKMHLFLKIILRGKVIIFYSGSIEIKLIILNSQDVRTPEIVWIHKKKENMETLKSKNPYGNDY